MALFVKENDLIKIPKLLDQMAVSAICNIPIFAKYGFWRFYGYDTRICYW